MVPVRGHGGGQLHGKAVLPQGQENSRLEIVPGAVIGKSQSLSRGCQGGSKHGGQVFVVGSWRKLGVLENPPGFPAQNGVVAAEQELKLGRIMDIDIAGNRFPAGALAGFGQLDQGC